MKNIELPDYAVERIARLRNGEDYTLVKDGIANSLSTLADLIQAGRDDDSISVWNDELLKVSYSLCEYNSLINILTEYSDGNLRCNDIDNNPAERNTKEDSLIASVGLSVLLWRSVNSTHEIVDVLKKLKGNAENNHKDILCGLIDLIEEIDKALKSKNISTESLSDMVRNNVNTTYNQDRKDYGVYNIGQYARTGIAELDDKIVGLYYGEKVVIFGDDEEGVNLFLDIMKKSNRIIEIDCACMKVSELGNMRKITVYKCDQKEQVNANVIDTAENVFKIYERDGRHFLSVLKNRMQGVFDFECEIK